MDWLLAYNKLHAFTGGVADVIVVVVICCYCCCCCVVVLVVGVVAAHEVCAAAFSNLRAETSLAS
jgi:hypothetical protein